MRVHSTQFECSSHRNRNLNCNCTAGCAQDAQGIIVVREDGSIWKRSFKGTRTTCSNGGQSKVHLVFQEEAGQFSCSCPVLTSTHSLLMIFFFSHANAWLFSSNIGHLLLLVQARATGQTPRGICQYTRANTHTGNRTERNVQSTCTPHPLCVSSSFASRIVPALLSNRINLLLLPPPAATSPRRCCYRCRCPLHRPAPRAPRWRRTEARAAAGRAGRIWRRGGQQSQRNRQCTEAQTTSRRRAFWSWQGPQASRAKAQRSTAREEHQHSRAFVAACSLCFVLYFCSALAVVFFFSSVFDDDKKHSQPTPRFVHNPRSLPCQMCVCVCFDFLLLFLWCRKRRSWQRFGSIGHSLPTTCRFARFDSWWEIAI